MTNVKATMENIIPETSWWFEEAMEEVQEVTIKMAEATENTMNSIMKAVGGGSYMRSLRLSTRLWHWKNSW